MTFTRAYLLNKSNRHYLFFFCARVRPLCFVCFFVCLRSKDYYLQFNLSFPLGKSLSTSSEITLKQSTDLWLPCLKFPSKTAKLSKTGHFSHFRKSFHFSNPYDYNCNANDQPYDEQLMLRLLMIFDSHWTLTLLSITKLCGVNQAYGDWDSLFENQCLSLPFLFESPTRHFAPYGPCKFWFGNEVKSDRLLSVASVTFLFCRELHSIKQYRSKNNSHIIPWP